MADRVSVPTLVMTGGPLDGTSYPLPLTGGEAIVGSSMDAGVQIMLGNVEPFHARVVLGPAGLAIEDAGSATGTFVNGEKVEGRHALQDGDRVCLGPPGAKGSAKLLVLLPGAARGASPALASDAAAPFLDAQLAAPSFGQEPTLAFSTEGEPAAAQEFDLSSEMVFDAQSRRRRRRRLRAAARGRRGRPHGGRRRRALRHPTAALRAPRAGPARPAFAAFPSPPPPPRAPPTARAAATRGREADRPWPPAPPPAPARTDAPRPEYHTELPSIPVEHRTEPAARSEFPPLRPAPKPAARTTAKGKGRPAVKRRRSFSLPRGPDPPDPGRDRGARRGRGARVVLLHPRDAARGGLDHARQRRGGTGRHPRREALRRGGGRQHGPLRHGEGAGHEASDTALEVVVPAGVKAQVPVVVQTKGGRSTPVTVTVLGTALATGLEPDVALPGQVVLVKGAGFQGQKLTAQVGGVAATAVEATAEGARVTIPAVPLPEGSKTSLVLKAGAAAPKSFDLYIGRLPLVTEVSPRRGAVGDRVVLKGRGFRPDPLANTVTFATQPALVLSATATELAVVAPPPPAGDIAPELPIVVTVAGRASAGTSAYALLRGVTSGFVPRFFAAPVTEFPGAGLVFVSTELGPVLLLGGPADAPSAADRAVRVATALNALVSRAASKPPAFELRERPQPSVGVVGEVSPFLVPTPEDAAAYSRDWETGRGAGRRVSPAAVARHWAALLQDYFGLFLYRQRPLG